MEMNEITTKYGELRTAFMDKINEFIKDNDGKITLNEKQTKKLWLFTNYYIAEIGVDENVSKGVYIKTTKGTMTAFDVIPFEIQYNIIGHIYEWFYLKMQTY